MAERPPKNSSSLNWENVIIARDRNLTMTLQSLVFGTYKLRRFSSRLCDNNSSLDFLQMLSQLPTLDLVKGRALTPQLLPKICFDREIRSPNF